MRILNIRRGAAVACFFTLALTAIAQTRISTTATAVQTSTTAAARQSTEAEATQAQSVYDVSVEPMSLDDATSVTSLKAYEGQVILIVNVASKCGYTKQYEGLEALYKKYKDQGFVVLGFPSNDFKEQEPGSEEEIVEFCRGVYGVSFPLFAKVHVTGEDKAPLYKYLTEGNHPGKGEVTWNFNKYLVGRDGRVVAHFESKVTPEDPVLDSQIKLLLAQKPPQK